VSPTTPFLVASLPNHTKMFELVHVVTSMEDFGEKEGGGAATQPSVNNPVCEFIDPRFRENKHKTLVFSHRKRAFWACFRENCVYIFRHSRQLSVGGIWVADYYFNC
jgi:hypothetical protein